MRAPRLSPRAFQRIALAALLAQMFIVVSGAAVRLTGSGLGCSDWPTCEQDRFVAPLEFHPMVEFGNRLITGLVSITVIAAVVGSLLRSPRRRDLTWWSVGLVVGVAANAVLGGITVLTHLTPPIVMAHFLLSVVLIWNAVVLLDRSGHDGSHGLPLVGPQVRWLSRALVGVSVVVLFTGTVVTGSGPHGGDESVERLPLYLTDVVRVHSVAMWVFLGLSVATLWLLYRRGTPRDVERRGQLLVAAIVAQGALGYLQYALAVPPALVALHVFGATLVWVAVLRFHLGLTAHPVERPAAAVVEPPRAEPTPAGAGAP